MYEQENKKISNGARKYLSDSERDQLAEVINMGAGNASTALSKMIGRKINISVPEVFVDKVENAQDFIGGADEVSTSILLKLEESIPGLMLFAFSQKEACLLSKLITGEECSADMKLNEMGSSGLLELGNIITGASMNAFSKFLGVRIMQSIPDIATDMYGAIINSILAAIGMDSDIILVFKVAVSVENEDITGDLYFFFYPTSTKKILEIIKNKIG